MNTTGVNGDLTNFLSVLPVKSRYLSGSIVCFFHIPYGCNPLICDTNGLLSRSPAPCVPSPERDVPLNHMFFSSLSSGLLVRSPLFFRQ